MPLQANWNCASKLQKGTIRLRTVQKIVFLGRFRPSSKLLFLLCSFNAPYLKKIMNIYDQLQAVEDRYEELGELLSHPDVVSDTKAFMELSKEESANS